MINQVLYNQVSKFQPKSIDEIKSALKESFQNIILYGLSKSDFFKKVSFYGGTSLRIFRELPRYSEDLDFTLIDKDITFSLNNYSHFIKEAFDAYGINSEIVCKDKSINTTVETIFVSFNMKEVFQIVYPDLSNKIIDNEKLNIKVEVEKSCFEGAIIEKKLLTFPSFCQVSTFTIETLFASKLIAVLNRNWKNRVKGRDLYDYLFYISNKVKINFIFLKNGLTKFGYISDANKYTLDMLKNDLISKFNIIDFNDAKKDVLPFIKSNDAFINSFEKNIFISSIDLIELK